MVLSALNFLPALPLPPPTPGFSNNQDPMVRGLALRSLCSLRLPAMVEYISDPLKASLVDANSYVRKTGVMAILKMWHLWPQAVEEGAMVDTLYNMLQDSDAQVCMYVCVRGVMRRARRGLVRI